MLRRFWDSLGMAARPMEYDPASLNQGQIDGSAMLEYMRREQSVVDRARKLVEGCSPYYNLAHVIELVRQADALGLDVVRRAVSAKASDV